MKYRVDYTSRFKKQYKKLQKQGKDLGKLHTIINMLANGLELDKKYHNHQLVNSKLYNNCSECHITPDWLLIYKIDNNDLIIVFIATGSHSDLF